MLKNLILLSVILTCTWYALQEPEKEPRRQARQLDVATTVVSQSREDYERKIDKVSGFSAAATGHNWVILNWTASQTEQSIQSFRLYRNNILLKELPAGQSSFKDSLLMNDQNYHYEIFVISSFGWKSAGSKTQVKTQKNSIPRIISPKNTVKLSPVNAIGEYLFTIKAQDKNKDRLYFTITGEDADKFMISQTTGKLINKEYLVREKDYKLQVEVSDGMSRNRRDIIIRT